MEGTNGEVVVCQNIQRQNCLLREKKKGQINSLVFLSWFLNSYKVQHILLLSLAHGTMPKPSYQEAMILGKWINFII